MEKDTNPQAYTDTAMTPVQADETEHLELFTATESAQQFVHKINVRDARRKQRRTQGSS